VPVGAGRGILVGADGVVGDDSWMEVFTTESGCIAVVQASGPDYPDILARALAYPVENDQDGDALTVDSGQLAISAPPQTAPDNIRAPGPVPSPGRCRRFPARRLTGGTQAF
jgi:hypothetical protein